MNSADTRSPETRSTDTRATSTQDYRQLMSTFPTGVAVITGIDADGVPRGMTCSSIASATLLPPTLLVCLRIGSGTLSAVTAHGEFAVNLLHDGGQRVAELFSRAEANRFSRVRWQLSDAGLPWLVRDAFAVAECKVSDLHTVGDHVVVLGEVTRIAQVTGTPLLYGMRRFAAWPQPAARRSGLRPVLDIRSGEPV